MEIEVVLQDEHIQLVEVRTVECIRFAGSDSLNLECALTFRNGVGKVQQNFCKV